MRHVAGSDVAREDLFARDFRDAVDPVFQDAIISGRARQQFVLEERGESARAERRNVYRDAADEARAQHLPARKSRAHCVGAPYRA
jgi:hypothetical protein